MVNTTEYSGKKKLSDHYILLMAKISLHIHIIRMGKKFYNNGRA